MTQQMQFIGFSIEQAKSFIQDIVRSCLEENIPPVKNIAEMPLTIKQACKIIGVSAPTLRKYVDMGVIRRHDLGPRKKVFYPSELEDDIKRIRK
ncbi:helix-turn-helix domain-containing protein [Pseudoflavitalea sp. X16]|uniref:helix-turn-helix domain-containing protein n=1 Tax=Paraflavitalea devenefica TaxID=2716334 RepID=UPI00141DF8B6|nr:helix-turn-helix domain-containing protein [Paraflavitalea devenefica]NII25151.1 helix-turn-helix domain-containing protein [Paraflavitalea devenefica]